MAEFWTLTPKELASVFAAHAWRQEEEQKRDLALAWYTAALSRTKKLPNLDRLLNPPKTRKLSAKEQRERAAEFAELKRKMGGERLGG